MKRILLTLITFCAYADPIKIAIIDTGLGYTHISHMAKVCPTGHRDFSSDKSYDRSFNTVDPVPSDSNGHGTNIAGIISDNIGLSDYCLVIIKYFNQNALGNENIVSSRQAMEYLNELRPDIVNYSGGGYGFDPTEYASLEKYLNHGGMFVAAAGNEKNNVDNLNLAYYPAMYDTRIVMVGNASQVKIKPNEVSLYRGTVHVDGENFYRLSSFFSNYGKRVNDWELGENVMGYGIVMTGTSQACAIKTGKLVKKMIKNR